VDLAANSGLCSALAMQASRKQRPVSDDPAPNLDDDDEPLRAHPGFLRRNLGLGAGVVAAFVLGIPASRILEAYRGVVLEKREGQMYVAFEDKPPRWVDGVEVAEGSVVEKERGHWFTEPAEARGRDIKLMQMYQRYTTAYEATIVRIDPPVSPGQAATAVAELPAGNRVRVPLWAEGLAGATVGSKLKKIAGTWDPVLMEDPVAQPGIPAAPSGKP
jgi:hypothetical protein